MSLNKLMEGLTDSQFLSLNKFAETVTFYRGGDFSNPIPVNVVWGADNTPGTNEVDGDGVRLDVRTGRKVRESIDIECSTDLVIHQNADPPDRFVRGNETATVKRIVGYDSGGMQTVRCIVSKGGVDRGKRRMG